ncbi:MAG: 2Fe-2S iron-sulfur cluster binding domain-containing protein [Pseudonocardiaceae bacterium]|nr:MAG: 2Fe-2S iron-sulfur cluster binding domain-containing protein [Pseudonocardiaceae bacterium]
MTTAHPITVAGTDIGFESAPGQTVLEAAETAGWAIPYSCRRGVCHSCVGDVTAGAVRDRRGGPIGPGDDVLFCQSVPDGPVEIRPHRITRAGPPRRRTLTTRVYRVRRPGPGVIIVELRFPIGRRVPFRPGQHLEVRLPGDESRAYSMANPPRDNDMAELHVRIEPGGLFSDRTARHLRPGDHLTVESPFGDATLQPGDGPLVLLATGTGFAPVRSVLLDQVVRRATRPTTVYWGGRDESDLYLLDDLRRWSQALPWLDVRPVLSRPGRAWRGATGHVQDVAAARQPDLSAHTVYACGNPAMIREARQLLTSATGLPRECFVADAFIPTNAPTASGPAPAT